MSVRLADRNSAPKTNPCMNKSINPYICVCERGEERENHTRMMSSCVCDKKTDTTFSHNDKQTDSLSERVKERKSD